MYRALFLAACAAGASAFAPASGVLPKASTARAAVSRGPSMQDRFAYKTSCGYDIQAPYWAENGGVFGWPDVIWAREAEVKHGRIAMLAATGLIVQDLFTLPFYSKWYSGEKVWALHDKVHKCLYNILRNSKVVRRQWFVLRSFMLTNSATARRGRCRQAGAPPSPRLRDPLHPEGHQRRARRHRRLRLRSPRPQVRPPRRD